MTKRTFDKITKATNAGNQNICQFCNSYSFVKHLPNALIYPFWRCKPHVKLLMPLCELELILSCSGLELWIPMDVLNIISQMRLLQETVLDIDTEKKKIDLLIQKHLTKIQTLNTLDPNENPFDRIIFITQLEFNYEIMHLYSILYTLLLLPSNNETEKQIKAIRVKFRKIHNELGYSYY